MSTNVRWSKQADIAKRRAVFERIGDLQLSTPIVSTQDGPRMSGKVSNFGGKKAAPFAKGGKRRKKVLAKAMLKKAKTADLSNVDLAVLDAAARKALPSSAFVFPSKRAYPIHDRAHAINALARSKGKPEHAVVKAAVKRKFPDLDHDGD